jgi:purine nucleoside permease
MRALTNLSNAKKIDLNRVLVLRTASDFDQPPPGITSAESVATKDSPDHRGILAKSGGRFPGRKQGGLGYRQELGGILG